MLQGDALAIQLFIGAAALNVLSVAMTQAGWTHRWFIRGMFGLAALLTVLSIGWPLVERAANIPAINDALAAIASNRVVWFLIGVIPAFIMGTRLDAFLKNRGRQKQTEPVEAEATKEQLYDLHLQIEDAKEKMKVDDEVFTKVNLSGLFDVTAILFKLAKINVPIPVVPPYTEIVQYDKFNLIMYQYLTAISPFLRDGDLALTRLWAAKILEILHSSLKELGHVP